MWKELIQRIQKIDKTRIYTQESLLQGVPFMTTDTACSDPLTTISTKTIFINFQKNLVISEPDSISQPQYIKLTVDKG